MWSTRALSIKRTPLRTWRYDCCCSGDCITLANSESVLSSFSAHLRRLSSSTYFVPLMHPPSASLYCTPRPTAFSRISRTNCSSVPVYYPNDRSWSVWNARTSSRPPTTRSWRASSWSRTVRWWWSAAKRRTSSRWTTRNCWPAIKTSLTIWTSATMRRSRWSTARRTWPRSNGGSKSTRCRSWIRRGPARSFWCSTSTTRCSTIDRWPRMRCSWWDRTCTSSSQRRTRTTTSSSGRRPRWSGSRWKCVSSVWRRTRTTRSSVISTRWRWSPYGLQLMESLIWNHWQ